MDLIYFIFSVLVFTIAIDGVITLCYMRLRDLKVTQEVHIKLIHLKKMLLRVASVPIIPDTMDTIVANCSLQQQLFCVAEQTYRSLFTYFAWLMLLLITRLCNRFQIRQQLKYHAIQTINM